MFYLRYNAYTRWYMSSKVPIYNTIVLLLPPRFAYYNISIHVFDLRIYMHARVYTVYTLHICIHKKQVRITIDQMITSLEYIICYVQVA